MSRLTVTIDTGNAAFDEDEAGQAATILRYLAFKLEHRDALPAEPWPLRYTNGNVVGQAEARQEDRE